LGSILFRVGGKLGAMLRRAEEINHFIKLNQNSSVPFAGLPSSK
jgi:hypothetical protein